MDVTGRRLLDAERQEAGRVGTHGKVCRLPVPVRASLPWLVPEEERTRGAGQPVERQKYIIDLTYSTAQKFLWDGKHEKAMPAVCMRCISALKCMAQVLCNWCLLISSWLRPALVLAIICRHLSISPKLSGLSSEHQTAALQFGIDYIAVWGFSVLLKETLNRLYITWQMTFTLLVLHLG